MDFPPRFVVQPSIALQHISAWKVLYFLSRFFASTIAAPHSLADRIKRYVLGNCLTPDFWTTKCKQSFLFARTPQLIQSGRAASLPAVTIHPATM